METGWRGPAAQRPRLHQSDVDALLEYDWPGNIRELQNVIERALIRAHQGKLALDVPSGESRQSDRRVDPESRLLTDSQLKQLERDNLVGVLNSKRWKIAGTGGAAEFLGVNAATLSSRLPGDGHRTTTIEYVNGCEVSSRAIPHRL